QARAEQNRLRLLATMPTRGVIYDRNGVVLARNVPSFTVAIVPADLPQQSQAEVSTKLGNLLDMSPEEIGRLVDQQRAQRYLFSPIPIRDRVDAETAFTIEERNAELPGVQILIEPTRQYTDGMSTSQVLGYVGRISAEEYDSLQDRGYELNDRLGKTGIELIYEKQLRGKPGKEQIEVNALGRKLTTIERAEPQAGDNLILTLDLDLQERMTELLSAGMGRSEHSVAIAMNPQTGEILSMVSLPSYDNNLFSTSISKEALTELLEDQRRPLFNRATGAMYPPGSIFKIVTGLAALQEGVATARTQIMSTGQITVPNKYDPSIIYTFRDWAPLGMLNFYQAVARSSDIYFYHLAGGYEEFKGLGVERLSRYAREFGLGQQTGIDLPVEAKGLVPDEHWKWETKKEPWLTGDTYNYGIGQGYLLTTPLQMLTVAATVAADGIVMRPQIVRAIVDADGNALVPFSPQPVRTLPVSPTNLQIMREGMRQAVEWGTATAAQVPGIQIAGKTGTAEHGTPDPVTGKYPTHAWFLCFAPYEEPEVALAVFLESGNGALDAAPIASNMLRYYFTRSGRIPAEQQQPNRPPPQPTTP
ncbi:MAG: penicillin-binding protein 2, partial [Chloroflexota bacterium]